MERFLFREDAGEKLLKDMHRFLVEESPNKNDMCTWRGVGCTRSTVSSFHLSSNESNISWILTMDWLPPSVQALHLERIPTWNGWLAERLPQDLRYMCLIFCSARFTSMRSINLHKLPRLLEELYVRQGWYEGAVHIANLPETMRVLCIQYRWINHAVIDEESLPKKLTHVRISPSDPDKIKILNTLGKRVIDPRVSSGADLPAILSESKFYAKFQAPQHEQISLIWT